MKQELLSQLATAKILSEGPRFKRLLHAPAKYIYAMVLRESAKRFRITDQLSQCWSCFGFDMFVRLPAGMDVYLIGAKSHDSELRLAKYIINNLHQNQVFVDVGAHFGYYSLLAELLVGRRGSVYAFEASPANCEVLKRSAGTNSHIKIYNKAVSDTRVKAKLYEFPTPYSEYNTLDTTQFEHESWFSRNHPTKVKVAAITLSEFFRQERVDPHMIKIDVEGSENKVIKGVESYLQNHAPIMIMEFLSAERSNQAHNAAHQLLLSLGYQVYRIDHQGHLSMVRDIPIYLEKLSLTSDNLVYQKDGLNRGTI